MTPAGAGARLLEPTDAAVREAAAALGRGELVAFPTDTLYALAASASDPAAVRAFYAAKRRPGDQPAVLLAPDAESLERWARFDRLARELAAEFWPGPLTLVLPLDEEALESMPGPQQGAIRSISREGTIAARVPAHAVALQLLESWGGPLCTSSANRAGEAPPTTGAEVVERLGADVALVLDGECPLGVASSILDLTSSPPRVLREGAIDAERLLR